jgi:hypothetical protein
VIEEEQLGFPLDGMDAVAAESPHAIRLELNALLERAKAAREAAPWDLDTHRTYRALVPEKAKALPPEEAEFLRRQLVLEFDRIELLLAA